MRANTDVVGSDGVVRETSSLDALEELAQELRQRRIDVLAVCGGDGSFSFPFVVDSCCAYEVTATSGGQSSQPQRFTVRVPKHLQKGAIAHPG